MSRRPREQQAQDQLELPRIPTFGSSDAHPAQPEPERGVVEVFTLDDAKANVQASDIAQKFGELVHSLHETARQRDELAQELEWAKGCERTQAETVQRLTEEMNQVRVDAEAHIKAELEVMSSHLEGVQGELAASTLAKGDLEYQLSQLRDRLEKLTTSKVYAFYPSRPNTPRVYVLAPTMSDAVIKYEFALPDHPLGQISVAVDKFIL